MPRHATLLLLLPLGACALQLGCRLQAIARPFAPAARVRMQDAEPNYAEMATAAIDNTLGMLADGVDPPPALLSLKRAVQDDDLESIKQGLFLLVLEQTLNFDLVDKDGVKEITPTTVDYGDKESERVKEKLRYVYGYGITMYTRGILGEDFLKSIVLDKLAGRVGLGGAEFDQYLEMPAVPA